jgi:ferritin-like metal-binding protein YciE
MYAKVSKEGALHAQGSKPTINRLADVLSKVGIESEVVVCDDHSKLFAQGNPMVLETTVKMLKAPLPETPRMVRFGRQTVVKHDDSPLSPFSVICK